MAADPAVGVDDDLAARQPRVAHGAAGHEPAGGVDVVLDAEGVEDVLRHDGLDHVLDDVPLDLLAGDVRAVLGRDYDRVDPHRLAVAVFDGDLGFAVRTDPGQDALFPDFRQAFGQAVGQDDGHGHQFGRLVRGVPEHQTLIARAPRVHAHGDVAGLLVDRGEDRAGVVIEPPGGVRIADLPDCLADDVGDLDIGLGGDLAGDERDAGGQDRFARDPAALVLHHDRVQDAVGNLIRDLVGMTFGDRFRGEQEVMSAH